MGSRLVLPDSGGVCQTSVMTSAGRKLQAAIGAFVAAIGFAIVIHTSIRAADPGGFGAVVPGTIVLGLGLAMMAVAMIRDDDHRGPNAD